MIARGLSVLAVALGALLIAVGWPGSPPTVVVSPTPTAGALSATPAPATSDSATPPIPDGYRIRIARLGIDLAIVEGDLTRDIDDQATPEGFAFHLPGTAIPGASGNAYLYSHARAGMFLALWDARVGDLVEVEAPDGSTLSYVVSEILPRIPPDDVSVARPTAEERLTLQTSTGPRPDDPRFVVVALPR